MAEGHNAQVRADQMLRAVSNCRGSMGTEQFAYLFLEFEEAALTVMATDGVQIVAQEVPHSVWGAYGFTVSIHEVRVPVLSAFLATGGASEARLTVGEAVVSQLQPDFLGVTIGQSKLMLPASDQAPPDWKAKIAERHVPGASVALRKSRLHSLLGSMPEDFILHLPAGDGQSVHLYGASPDQQGVQAWLMPMMTTEPGALNQKVPE